MIILETCHHDVVNAAAFDVDAAEETLAALLRARILDAWVHEIATMVALAGQPASAVH